MTKIIDVYKRHQVSVDYSNRSLKKCHLVFKTYIKITDNVWNHGSHVNNMLADGQVR